MSTGTLTVLAGMLAMQLAVTAILLEILARHLGRLAAALEALVQRYELSER